MSTDYAISAAPATKEMYEEASRSGCWSMKCTAFHTS